MKKKSIDHTQLLLLKLLSTEDMYGYQIILELARRSSNVFEMKEGTLYPVLHGMEREGYAESRGIIHKHGPCLYNIGGESLGNLVFRCSQDNIQSLKGRRSCLPHGHFFPAKGQFLPGASLGCQRDQFLHRESVFLQNLHHLSAHCARGAQYAHSVSAHLLFLLFFRHFYSLCSIRFFDFLHHTIQHTFFQEQV